MNKIWNKKGLKIYQTAVLFKYKDMVIKPQTFPPLEYNDTFLNKDFLFRTMCFTL